ncbi:MAG: fatty acid desaturase [Proteobacteria bacterium]|nr:fatty acid desaturase [Pseudomonadota bacterium]
MRDGDLDDEPAPAAANPRGTSQTIAGAFIRRAQRRHFLLYNVGPFAGFVVAIALCWWVPVGPIEIGLLAGLWALSMIGMSLGLHRYFAHRAFKTSRAMRRVLAVLGCLAGQGPVVSWVAVHRRHHEHSDQPGDPHSPNPAHRGTGPFATARGLWHAHVGWLVNHEYPNPLYYATDLVRDKPLMRANRYYAAWVVAGLVVPAAIGGLAHGSWLGALLGFLWGGPVRLFIVDNSILSINSFSHTYGSRAYRTGDNSRNNAWVALPTFGESWQNNHHAFASSARIGLQWWQIDLGYLVLCGLEALGLVWDVKRPNAETLAAKRII